MSDIDKIINAYIDRGHDFGFSATDETEQDTKVGALNEKASVAEQKLQDRQERLKKVEELIMPLLTNLLKSADQKYILWPSREKPVRDIIEKLLKLTRT